MCIMPTSQPQTLLLHGCSSGGPDAVTDFGALNMSSTVDAMEHRMVRLGASAQRHVVKAIVFYGRRGTVQMLNCYLERNLLRNGGLLSEVLPCFSQRPMLGLCPPPL